MSSPRTTAAGDFDYDANGQEYARLRRTDPRIAAFVHAALGVAGTVLNVGAGAGSYEPDDRYVLAVEPSATMRAQRPQGLTPAIKGIAEDLPVDDKSVDASMALVTIHQWSDPLRGLDELRRVTRGPIVVLTFDGDALEHFWLADYAPELIAADRRRYPSIDTIRNSLGRRGRRMEVQIVPIPIDCVDGFTEAYYARPERLLDVTVRRAQSAWSFVGPDVQERFVNRLSEDLRTGVWDRRYGALREQSSYDGSLRLIVSSPSDVEHPG